MKPTFRCSGVDERGGHRRSEVLQAWNGDDAVAVANEMGLLPDEVEQLTTVWSVARQIATVALKWLNKAYGVVLVVLKVLFGLAAVFIVAIGFLTSDTVFQQIAATALGCFLGIFSRLMQAEEHRLERRP